MKPALPSPWCTRAEAAEYLRVSCDTVDRRLIPADKPPTEGKIRFRRVNLETARTPIRLITEDVFRLLPQPTT